ncbi:LLM class flavin-dependent oxidoreductase [Gordonia sp. DT30]|uniref:LLM class flavin-dependent oxidoreductase n=1 Tax=Gordonia sp. DT30 TaxID=3416546 RepID=UPI003CE96927
MTEIWTIEMSQDLERMAEIAESVESHGWDGMHVTDSQNRSPEPYVALTVAALATTRLGLGIGVSNPTTRHPALAAASAASVQRISNGRMTLTIGRGDSSAAQIGGGPATLKYFERYVRALRRYLNREPLTLEEAHQFLVGSVPSIDSLGLAGNPLNSSLGWLRESDPAVPLEITGSGAKVLAIASRVGERAMVAVGADPERVDWAVTTVRALGERPVGAFVNVVAHDDPAVARRLIRGVLASTARFSVMHGVVNGPADSDSQKVLSSIHSNYDMNGHGTAGSHQSAGISDRFVATHGIAGTPEECVRRLRELEELGISKFVVFPVGRRADAVEAERARTILDNEVVPFFSNALRKPASELSHQ